MIEISTDDRPEWEELAEGYDEIEIDGQILRAYIADSGTVRIRWRVE